MADEAIVVSVTDKVANTIATKFTDIATSARTAFTGIQQLQAMLNTLNAGGLAQLNSQMRISAAGMASLAQSQGTLNTANAQAQIILQRLTQAQAQSALAQQRLTTAQTQQTIVMTNAATAHVRLTTAQSNAQRAATNAATAQQKLATETQRTAAATSNAAAAADRARLARLQLTQAEEAGTRSGNNLLGGLKSLALQYLGVTAVIAMSREILQLADAYTVMQNKLQNVSTSQAQVNELTGRLFDLANETRSSVDATTQAFTRFDRSLMSMGKSQEDTLRMTETINKALVNSGATAQESSSALLQLSQAFNSGKLQGDEFRAVSENMPSVLDAVAKATNTPINQVKALGTAGKITSEVLFKAFTLMQESVDATFAKSIPTLSQAMVVLKNQAMQFFGELNTASGITKGIAQSIIDLGTYFSDLRKEVTANNSPIENLLGVLQQLTSLMGSELISLLGSAADKITGLDSSLTSTSTGARVLELGIKSLILIFQTFALVGSDLGFIIGRLADTAVVAGKTINAIGLGEFAKVGELDLKYKTDSEAARKELDEFQKQVTALSVAPKLTTAVTDAAKTSSLRGTGTNTIVAGPDKAAESRARSLAKVNAQLDAESKNMFLVNPQREISQKFDDIEIALASKKIKLNPQETQTIKDKIAANIQNKQVQQQMDSIYQDSTGAATLYNNQLQAANILQAQGNITQEQYLVAINKAKEAYSNATDPLYSFNQGIKDQVAIYAQVGPAQEIERQVIAKQNELRAQGKSLTDAQTASMREQLATTQQLSDVNQLLNGYYDGTMGKQRELLNTQTALNQAYAAGYVGTEQYGIQLQKLAVDTANLKMQMGTGNFTDALNAGMGSFVSNYTGMMSGLSAAWGDFFTTFNNGFADSIGKAITQGGSLRDMLADVAQQVTGSMISALIKLGMQYVVNAALGTSLSTTALATTTALSVAAGTATAAAWAPAAAMVSLATLGANSAPAMAGIAATTAMTSASSIMGGLGYKDGGYTGNVGTSTVAGVVHGGEFVMDAAATSRIGVSNLEALQNGGSIDAVNSNSNGAGSGSSVNNFYFNFDQDIVATGSGNDSSADTLEKSGEALSQKVQSDLMDSIRSGGVWSKIIKQTANS